MNEFTSIGKIIIIIGLAIVVFGAVVLVISKLTGGRGGLLPGDIVIRKDNVTIYFPIISSIVISLILTLIFWLVSVYRR
ncbi:MAG: DUF2905 family protein [Armatimonadota bacterium]